MIKYILVFCIGVLFCGSTLKTVSNVEEFHIKVVGKEKVIEFKNRFPDVANDRAVYIAYLQQYYRGHEDEFVALF